MSTHQVSGTVHSCRALKYWFVLNTICVIAITIISIVKMRRSWKAVQSSAWYCPSSKCQHPESTGAARVSVSSRLPAWVFYAGEESYPIFLSQISKDRERATLFIFFSPVTTAASIRHEAWFQLRIKGPLWPCCRLNNGIQIPGLSLQWSEAFMGVIWMKYQELGRFSRRSQWRRNTLSMFEGGPWERFDGRRRQRPFGNWMQRSIGASRLCRFLACVTQMLTMLLLYVW